MAYAVVVTEGPKRIENGRIVQTFQIEETDVAPADQWTLPVPDGFALALFKADMETAGAGTTLTPELGTITGWVSGGAGHIVAAAAADANHRIVSDQLEAIDLDGGALLYGRSVPDTDTGDTAGPHITTRITIVRG